jgi:hypothetical protein
VIRATLRSDAFLLLGVGALLLASSWKGLFDAVDLPDPQPALWTQLAGVLLVALGYLLWIAPRDVRLTQGIALAAAFANGAGAVVIVAWLLFGELDTGGFGTTLLALTAAVSAVYAVAEAWIASRSVAMLLPPD